MGSKKSVLFVSRHYSKGLDDNLSQKFLSQFSGGLELGLDAHYLTLESDGVFLNSDVRRIQLTQRRITATAQLTEKLRHYAVLFAETAKILRRSDFDYVYVRSAPPLYNYFRMLYAARSSGARIAIEIPTHPTTGETATTTRLRRLLLVASKRARRLEARYADLYAVIGEDVHGAFRGRPAVNIHNGIDTSGVPQRTPNTSDRAVHLIGVASMCRWHGYDRIIRAMIDAPNQHAIVLHLAGPDGDGSLARWRSLADEHGLGDRVRFEGVLRGAELDELIDRCDLGLGSLGMHRIGLDTASTLKAREYMARGLPFVYASGDPTLEHGAPGCARIPSGDQPIDLSTLVTFAEAARRDAGLPAMMRAYASEHLSWSAQLRTVFSALSHASTHSNSRLPNSR